MMNVLTIRPPAAATPACTLAMTAATSPRTMIMYLPEQMDRESNSSVSAAFSIASAI